jgi:predicted hydrocarbon binding protein
MIEAFMSDPSTETTVYYIPNKFGRLFLQSFEEVLGSAGLIAAEKLANLDHLVGALPANTVSRDFRFNDLSRIHETLEQMYGPRAGRGLALRAGRVSFKYGLRELGYPLGISTHAFRLLPLSLKIQTSLGTLADLFNRYTEGSVNLIENHDTFIWRMESCPLCWKRSAEAPCCHLLVGLLQETLFWLSSGKNFLVEETACIASGEPACSFQISRKPLP